jgi:hypothetical protein
MLPAGRSGLVVLSLSLHSATIKVQTFDTDTADAADRADRSWRVKLSSRDPKKLFFVPVEEVQ